jgi:hypothetical protein
MTNTTLQRCAAGLAGRLFVPLALALVICLPALCDLVTAPKEYVALKKQLNAVRYEGAGFMTDKVYEMQGRLSGVIKTSERIGADIQTAGQTLHVRLPALPKGISAGANIRVLVRMHPDEGVLEAIALVTERDGNLFDPDPKPAPDPPKVEPKTEAQPTAKAPPAAETGKSPTAKDWLDYFTRIVQYYNPRLDYPKASRIAANILYQSDQWKVDPLLIVAVIATESHFNPQAVSHSGAMGLAQLMPATARGMGLTNAYNVEQNVYASVRIIMGHLERHSDKDPWNQFALALASYNAGSGNVRKYGGVPPFKETQNYIRKVYATYKALHDSLGS